MLTTTHYKGHKWTTEELRRLMALWDADAPVTEIASQLNATAAAIAKQVVRMRQQGIPLKRRDKNCGVPFRSHRPWTQAEVDFLVRRRLENATSEEIALALDRSIHGVDGMISKLREEGVPVAMRGTGVKRLWSAQSVINLYAGGIDPQTTVDAENDFSTTN